MMPRIHFVGNQISKKQAFKRQFNDSIVKASETIQNLYLQVAIGKEFLEAKIATKMYVLVVIRGFPKKWQRGEDLKSCGFLQKPFH